MKRQFLICVLLSALLMISCGEKKQATSLETKPQTTAQMIIPESPDTLLPTGRRNIFLVSRRELPGLFVERAYFPPGYKSNPHSHNGDLNITVISGSFNLVFKDNNDSAISTKVYGPGSFIIIPARQVHFEWFTEKTLMDITGIGPLNTMSQSIIRSSK
jgi:quercetin dioxygenase-like cupin family protein